MDGETLNREILDKIPTLSKRNELLSQIEILINGLNKKDTEELTEIGEYIHARASESRNYKEYLAGIKKAVMSLPILELTVAFVPTQREVKDFVLSIRNEVDGLAVVDVNVNPYILGGARIAFKGKYFDGSVLSKIQNV